MAHSNNLCSVKPALGWRAEQLKRQIKTEIIFFHWQRIPGGLTFFKVRGEQWGVQKRRGRCPWWNPTSTAEKGDVMAQSVYIFLKTKAVWKMKQNIIQMRITKKHTADESWKKHKILFHGSCTVLQSYTRWFSFWRLIHCYAGEWPPHTRKAIDRKGLSLFHEKVAVRRPG